MNICENHRIDFKYLDNNSTVVDAGACKGSFIKYIQEHLDCKIYAIEPCRTHFDFLKNKEYSNVGVFNKALVGDDVGFINFNEYVGLPKWGSLYNRNVKHAKLKETVSYLVEALDINNIFNTFEVDHIDYLKLDIEGAEFDVFYSMYEATSSRIYQFSAEIHPIKYKKSDINNLISTVKRLGYRYEWFEKDHELWGIQESKEEK